MSDLSSVRSIRDAVQRGERSAVDICNQTLSRIEALNGTLNAFNTVTREQAVAALDLAREALTHYAGPPR